jgi:hypothetical protein
MSSQVALTTLPDNPTGVRDRALLLIGFAGALRRTELAAVEVTARPGVDWIEETGEGLVVHIASSKGDQEGAGQAVGIPFGTHSETCPVRALRAWLQAGQITDEAHKLSAHYYGSKLEKTGRFRFAEKLGAHVRHLRLMTATPHNGKEEDFQLFMSLLDSDLHQGRRCRTCKGQFQTFLPNLRISLFSQGIRLRPVRARLLSRTRRHSRSSSSMIAVSRCVPTLKRSSERGPSEIALLIRERSTLVSADRSINRTRSISARRPFKAVVVAGNIVRRTIVAGFQPRSTP